MADIPNIPSTTDNSISTVIIKPGQKIILPQGATIQSVILDGSIDVVSSCDNLPDPSTYKCGYFVVVVDNDDNTGHSMDETSVFLTSLKVANNTYIINRKLIASGDGAGIMQTSAVLNTHVPDQAIFTFTQLRRDTLTKRQNVFIYFKTPSDLFDSLELKVSNWDTVQYYRPLEAACDTYEFGDEGELDYLEII